MRRGPGVAATTAAVAAGPVKRRTGALSAGGGSGGSNDQQQREYDPLTRDPFSGIDRGSFNEFRPTNGVSSASRRRDIDDDSDSHDSQRDVDQHGNGLLIRKRHRSGASDDDDNTSNSDDKRRHRSTPRRGRSKNGPSRGRGRGRGKIARTMPRSLETPAGIQGLSRAAQLRQQNAVISAFRKRQQDNNIHHTTTDDDEPPLPPPPPEEPEIESNAAEIERSEYEPQNIESTVYRTDYMPLSSALFDRADPVLALAPGEGGEHPQDYMLSQSDALHPDNFQQLQKDFSKMLVKVSMYADQTILPPPEARGNGITTWSLHEEIAYIAKIRDITLGLAPIPTPHNDTHERAPGAPSSSANRRKTPEDRVLESEARRRAGLEDEEGGVDQQQLSMAGSDDLNGRDPFAALMENDMAAALEDGTPPEPPVDREEYHHAVREPKLVLSPDYERVVRLIGKPRDSFYCWGCSSARMDSASVPFKKYNEMAKFFKEQYGHMDTVQLSLQLWIFFEMFIRLPANTIARKRGLQLIAPWYPVEIWEHMTVHMAEPSVWVAETLSRVKHDAEQTRRYGLYMSVKNAHGDRVRLVNPKQWKVYREMIATVRQLHNCNPSSMYLYNPTMSVSWVDGRGFTNTQRPMHVVDVPTTALTAK